MADENSYFDKVQGKTGRPKMVLNKHGIETISGLAAIMCTEKEIREILKTDNRTLNAAHNKKAYTRALETGYSAGRIKIRRKQFQLLEEGNAAIVIWLAKNFLGQTDKQEVTTKDDTDKTVKISIVPASQGLKE